MSTINAPYNLIAQAIFTDLETGKLTRYGQWLLTQLVEAINSSSSFASAFEAADVPSSGALALTSGAIREITSISLPAGTWDVFSFSGFSFSGVGVSSKVSPPWPVVPLQGGFGTSAGSFYGVNTSVSQSLNVNNLIGNHEMVSGRWRLTSASAFTVYLLAQATFSSGNVSAYGAISAASVQV